MTDEEADRAFQVGIQPVLAWTVAVALATLAGVVSFAPMSIFACVIAPACVVGAVGPLALVGGALTAIPSVALIHGIRASNAPRPFAEIISVLAMLLLPWMLAAGYMIAAAPEALIPWANAFLPPILVAAVIGGTAYWLLVGRPRPPYA